MAEIVNTHDLRISRLELGPYGTNCYIVVCRATGHSLLVDAPAEAGQILSALKGTRPRYIVITHNHFDHTQALREVKDSLNIPIACHPLDAGRLPCPADIELKDGDPLTTGHISLNVIHTPGHTPGSICLHTGKYLLAGDTIFPGGPGHTETASDLTTLVQSIVTRIVPLPDDTVICPGHGDSAVLGDDKPAIAGFNARTHTTGLCGDVLWSA